LADEERGALNNPRIVEDREDVNNEVDDARSNSSQSLIPDLATVVKTRYSREARPNYRV